MKRKLFLLGAILVAAFSVASFSGFAQDETIGDDGSGTGPTKGYKSSWGSTWICHCPTYQQFDCYCAG